MSTRFFTRRSGPPGSAMWPLSGKDRFWDEARCGSCTCEHFCARREGVKSPTCDCGHPQRWHGNGRQGCEECRCRRFAKDCFGEPSRGFRGAPDPPAHYTFAYSPDADDREKLACLAYNCLTCDPGNVMIPGSAGEQTQQRTKHRHVPAPPERSE